MGGGLSGHPFPTWPGTVGARTPICWHWHPQCPWAGFVPPAEADGSEVAQIFTFGAYVRRLRKQTLQGPKAKADWKISAVASNYKRATENFIACFQERIFFSSSSQKRTKPRGCARGYIRAEESFPPLAQIQSLGKEKCPEL